MNDIYVFHFAKEPGLKSLCPLFDQLSPEGRGQIMEAGGRWTRRAINPLCVSENVRIQPQFSSSNLCIIELIQKWNSRNLGRLTGGLFPDFG